MKFHIAAWLMVFAGFAASAQSVAPEPPEREPHESGPRDPYMPPPPLRTSVPMLFTDRKGFPPSVQVNVTPDQLNILGDAANEPSIAVDPLAPNRIVIGWRQFDNVASNFRQAGYGWSNDGGLTWRKNTLTPGTFRSDPVMRAGPDGTIYYNTLKQDFSCWVFRSSTGGQSWSTPVYSNGGDKQWMVVDRSSGPGRGFIYQMDSFGGFAKSTNGGLTWSFSSYPLSHGTLSVGPVGELFGGGGGVVARSLNANHPTQVPTFSIFDTGTSGGGWGDPFNPGGLAGQSIVGVDTSGGPRHGWVYLLDVTFDVDADVSFARSANGGVTWSTPIRLQGMGSTPYAGHQWFGTMSISPDGRIDVVYNDTASRTYSQSQLLYVFSHDGGVTWSAPEAMGPVWNSVIGWPNQDKIGDYYDMESDLLGAHVAYAATYNNEQDVYYLRIGPKDCNANGVDDADETLSGVVLDANDNRIPDSCEIAAGAVQDMNANGFPDDACGDIDFNNDELLPDTADISDFLHVYDGMACSTCDTIDFNHDGLFPDTADIDFLLRVFSGGPC